MLYTHTLLIVTGQGGPGRNLKDDIVYMMMMEPEAHYLT
jgi:hypothetical protein